VDGAAAVGEVALVHDPPAVRVRDLDDLELTGAAVVASLAPRQVEVVGRAVLHRAGRRGGRPFLVLVAAAHHTQLVGAATGGAFGERLNEHLGYNTPHSRPAFVW